MDAYISNRLENVNKIRSLAKELSKFDVLTVAEMNDSEPDPKCYIYTSHTSRKSSNSIRIHYVSPMVETHGNDGSYSWGIMRWSDVLNNLKYPDIEKLVDKYLEDRTDLEIVLYNGIYNYVYKDDEIIDIPHRLKLILALLGDIIKISKNISTKFKWNHIDDLLLGQKFILTNKRQSDRESNITKIVLKILKEKKSPNFCIGIPFVVDDVNSILMEHCGITMYVWMTQQRRRYENIFSILLQVTFSLFLLKSIGITHGDMHMSNICIIHSRSIQKMVTFKWGNMSYDISGNVCPILIDFSRSIMLKDIRRDPSKIISRLRKYLESVGIEYSPIEQSILFDCMLMLDLYKLYSTVHGIAYRSYKKEEFVSHIMENETANSVDNIIDTTYTLKNLVKQHIIKTMKQKKSSLNMLTNSLKKEFTNMIPNLYTVKSGIQPVSYTL